MQAIETVTRHVTGCSLDRVPSSKWVSRVILEADLLLSRQFSERMETETQVTLTTDTATHNNISFMGAQVHFKDGTSHTLGTKESCTNFIGVAQKKYYGYDFVQFIVAVMSLA